MEGYKKMKQVSSILCLRRPVLGIFADSLICLIVSWLFLFSDVFASTYHVRTDGNNNCNGLTDAAGLSGNCAFRTVLKGIQTAVGGDNVIVHTGNYTGEALASVRSGSSGSLIAIQAATGEIISISRISITHNYNVISGFVLTLPGGWNSGAVQLTGSFNQAINNTVLGNNRGDSGYGNAFGIAGNNNTVSYNIIDGQRNAADKSFTWAFHIGGNYNEITHNLIKDTNSIERVFELYGTYNHIAYNEVSNVAWTIGGGSHPDLFQVFGSNDSYGHVIENNYFHDFDGQLGNLETSGGIKDNWIFRNNIFANITSAFFGHWGTLYFYNNTFYRTSYASNGTNLIFGAYGGTATPISNAFIACGTSASNGWYDSGVANADYNFVSNTPTGGTKSGFSEVHGRNGGNPLLTAVYDNCVANVCDFRPRSGSVLIDNGVAVAGFSSDYAGTSRPQGLRWDIGAFEFIGGTFIPKYPGSILVR